MKRPNNILTAGLLLVPSTFVLRLLQIKLPGFLEGCLLGTGIGLEILGVFVENYGLSKLRNFKLKIFNRIFRHDAA